MERHHPQALAISRVGLVLPLVVLDDDDPERCLKDKVGPLLGAPIHWAPVVDKVELQVLKELQHGVLAVLLPRRMRLGAS